MKKIIAILFCLLFSLTACSGQSEKKTEINDDNLASYVGAGEMTLINILINSNAKFVNEILVADHLPVDETTKITNPQGTFALVVSDEYKTLSDLESRLKSTYTTEAVKSILDNQSKYTDIEGKLYFNMKYAQSDYSNDWSAPEISASLDADGKYLINITIKDAKGKDVLISASAVSENGTLKLENIYS